MGTVTRTSTSHPHMLTVTRIRTSIATRTHTITIMMRAATRTRTNTRIATRMGAPSPPFASIIHHAQITPRAREFALTAFELLGRAEAKIHGMPLDSVHFHEVGAVDAIVDIVCATVGLDSLAIDQWRCSPVNVGGGFVDCAHGRFPVPAPATAELLKGVPTYSSGIQSELVTPTGAALLRALNCSFGDSTAFAAHCIGYGAGTRNPEKFPNVLRLSIGEQHTVTLPEKETVTVLECALDDLSPQVVAYAADQALALGALDVMRTPVTMKKGRIGTLLTVLCRDADAEHLQELLFRETSTLGVRIRQERRVVLARAWSESGTPYGPVRIKTGMLNGAIVNAAPEYEDCRARAETHGIPLKHVMASAAADWREKQEPRPEPEQPTHS